MFKTFIDTLFNFAKQHNFRLVQIKGFANGKILVNLNETSKLVLEKVENIVGKGESVGDQHFSTMFSKAFFLRIVKSREMTKF